MAFVSALAIGAVLIAIADPDTRAAASYFFSYPIDTFTAAGRAVGGAYLALFQGAIFNPTLAAKGTLTGYLYPLSETLVNATPLIVGGLSVGLAFRAGLFNIGGQGQIIIGAIFAGYVGFHWHLPAGIHVIAAILAGMLGGALWGGLAGWLKARTGAHEVITTIMLNYIAGRAAGIVFPGKSYDEVHFALHTGDCSCSAATACSEAMDAKGPGIHRRAAADVVSAGTRAADTRRRRRASSRRRGIPVGGGAQRRHDRGRGPDYDLPVPFEVEGRAAGCAARRPGRPGWRTSSTRPVTRTRAPLRRHTAVLATTVTSPVPSLICCSFHGTGGAPHDLVTTPSSVTCDSDRARVVFQIGDPRDAWKARNRPADRAQRARGDQAQPSISRGSSLPETHKSKSHAKSPELRRSAAMPAPA